PGSWFAVPPVATYISFRTGVFDANVLFCANRSDCRHCHVPPPFAAHRGDHWGNLCCTLDLDSDEPLGGTRFCGCCRAASSRLCLPWKPPKRRAKTSRFFPDCRSQ